jgi:hypothetical protein
MRCRYCARPLQKPDYVKKVQSLRKALDGIQAEFLMFDYEESFEQVAGPSVVGRDSDGNVTGFTAAQCVLYTHIKNGWQVAVHPCFKKGGIIFRAKGAATKPNDAEAFADFFKLVMRDGETRGRKESLTVKQMAASLRNLDADAVERQLAEALGVTRRRIQQVLEAAGLTWDTFKQWALSGAIKFTIPVLETTSVDVGFDCSFSSRIS